VVIDRDQIAINSAYNRPNPFSSETWFEFNHNQANETMDVEIEIYDLSGRKLAVLQQNNLSSSFYPAPLRWDGTSADGRRLSGGIYIYRVQIKDAKGQSASMVKKLVISR
jgi:flagellar hook assembly protein FlgD